MEILLIRKELGVNFLGGGGHILKKWRSKCVQNMSEKMSDMARKVEKPKTKKSQPVQPKYQNHGSKEDEVDYNHGTLFSQPMIHFQKCLSCRQPSIIILKRE